MTPDVNSPAFIIRDGLLNRLKAVPTFASVERWATSAMRRAQPEQIPYFGLYLMEESISPDGSFRDAEPRFIHDIRIGFSVIIQNNDPEAAEANLDTAYWAIMRLLTNQNWTRFACDPPADDASFKFVRIEGVLRGYRKHVFGNAGHNNQTPIAELQADWTLRTTWDYPPVITDQLDLVHVTVAYPWPYDPGAYDPPFTVQYDLT